LFRGKWARSISRTLAPPRASARAAVDPAGPAPTIMTSGLFARQLASARKICEQLICPVGSGGHLTPQSEADEDPASLSHGRTHERTLFPSDVVLERLVNLNEIRVPLILGVPRS
jgi:hypothetical protein